MDTTNINDKRILEKDDNKLSHLSFEEYFESNWRKQFQERETIQSILDAAGLSGSHDFLQINSKYLIDDNRIAIIALIKRKNSEVLDKLIIDVFASSPTFEQFMDVIYNIGSDCDYRLILYDVNTKIYPEGIIYCHDLISELMDHFDDIINMSLIWVDCIRDENYIPKIQYKTFKTITNNRRLSQKELPERRIFEEAEFWGPYVNTYLGGDFPCTFGFEIDCKNSSTILELGLESTWTDDDGIAVKIELSDTDEQSFNTLLKKYNKELSEDFKGCSIEYIDGILFVKKNIPFRNFVYALPSNKQKMIVDFFEKYERPVMFYVEEIFKKARSRLNISILNKNKSSNVPDLLK